MVSRNLKYIFVCRLIQVVRWNVVLHKHKKKTNRHVVLKQTGQRFISSLFNSVYRCLKSKNKKSHTTSIIKGPCRSRTISPGARIVFEDLRDSLSSRSYSTKPELRLCRAESRFIIFSSIASFTNTSKEYTFICGKHIRYIGSSALKSERIYLGYTQKDTISTFSCKN